ncbi:T9SS type A sorting domain-containing protein [Flavobacterium sp. N3904]|uniref:T9SS type A sorting domain-containing protein n=1 Tax=Flavobacterium sp. N3904 TaxID=2986835 RepID=UPI002224AD30|nr:T9SS type A sorting domain-containing protein [Flavobacterium sp. N3904]
MKKILLSLLLLTSLTFYSQVANMVQCAGDTNFNLTNQYTALISNLNPAETTLSYYITLDDATNGTNAISNPTNFVSGIASQIIYARIDHLGTITTNYFNLIVNPSLITAHSDEQPYNCYNNGSAKVEVLSGGTPPYFYSIDNGPFTTNNIFTSLYPGEYVITTKDAVGCSVAFTHVLYPVNSISVNTNVVNNYCYGQKEGSIEIIASGGAGSYKYSLKNKKSGVILANNQSQNTFSKLPAGLYIVTVSDVIGCTSSEHQIEIFEPDPILLNTTTTTATCVNNKATLTVSAIGGTTPYQYSIDNGITFTSNNVFSSLVPGTYAIVVRDVNNCMSSVAATVTPVSYPTIVAVVSNVTCNGANNGSIEVSTIGGQTPYQYSLNGSTYQTSNNFNNLYTGVHTIQVIDFNGCTSIISIVLKEPAPLSATVTTNNQTIIITATGGSGTYQYAIYPNLNQFFVENTFANLTPGNYIIIVQDLNGCDVITSQITINPPAPFINGSTTVNQNFTQGQTLADLVIPGENIKWYSTPKAPTNKLKKATEASLPLSTLLVDNTTYYASQTINGIESTERLAVTVKLGALGTNDFAIKNFRYYPNPVKNLLAISNTSIIDEVNLISIKGETLLTKKINSLHYEIDLSNFSKGVYFLKVKAEGTEKIVKLIKE